MKFEFFLISMVLLVMGIGNTHANDKYKDINNNDGDHFQNLGFQVDVIEPLNIVIPAILVNAYDTNISIMRRIRKVRDAIGFGCAILSVLFILCLNLMGFTNR